MFVLEVINVIVQESFIVAKLLPDWDQANLVNSALSSHCFKREQKLLTDVNYFS
jgi:hypothetical protein